LFQVAFIAVIVILC